MSRRSLIIFVSGLLLVAATACGKGKNQKPEANLYVDPTSPHAGNSATFDASASVDHDGHIVNYKFEFGDGTAPIETEDAVVEHTYAAETGGLIARLTVTDNRGATDTVELTLNSVNDAPVVTILATPNPADKFETIQVDVSNSSDPDGEIVGYEFDFGDGNVVSQADPVIEHAYDVINFQDTTYTLRVTAFDNLNKPGSAEISVQVSDLPPSVSQVDPGLDGLGVIGEWITVIGKNIFDPPTVTVDGVPAKDVEVVDEFSLRFRVPPRTRSGTRNLDIVWEGYEGYYGDLDVRRFAALTSPVHNKTYFLDINGNQTVTVPGLEMGVSDAVRVKISPDGSTAYVADGRFSLGQTGNITIVDLTADGGPLAVADVQVGVGPLFDIEAAPETGMLAALDVAGFTLFDISDPQTPVNKGYTLGDNFASTDLAISADGSRVVLLDAINDQACVYELTGFTVNNAAAPTCLAVGQYTQDVVISPDNAYALVLGGGGEGAIPPNFDSGSDTTITVLDIANSPATVVGSYNLRDLAGYSVAPVPFDLFVGPDSGTLYVVTLDETITDFIDLVQEFLNTGDPLLLVQIILAITGDGISFGGVVPVNNPTDPVNAAIGTVMREGWTAPTSGDALFTDGVALTTSFSLDWDNGPVIQHGYSYANLDFSITTHDALEPAQDLSLDELLNLLVGLAITGDTSIQP